VELVRLQADEHVVLLGMHHIVYDAWSFALAQQELFVAYQSYAAGRPSPLATPAVQYADYAIWQRQRLQGEVYEQLRGYWCQQLAGVPPLELPTDRPRPPVRTTAGGSRSCLVPRDVREALEELARREQVTLFMLLMAGFQTLLSRYSGQEDFAVATPVAGRLRPEVEQLIGYFVNTLAVRADLSGNPTFRQLLARVRDTWLAAFDHQEMPFERLIQELQLPRDTSRHPVVQALLVLQNVPTDSNQVQLHGF
jgi:hypothetical protein